MMQFYSNKELAELIILVNYCLKENPQIHIMGGHYTIFQ